jgi:hypothetical protein
MKYFLLLILMILSITGCSTKMQIDNEKDTHTYFKEEPWIKKGKPEIGISLSGGGSKASPFAMGVLKRFIDEGWLDDVDIISSVSGGGYSAYYLYSKALYLKNNPDKSLSLKSFFENYELDNLNQYKHYKDYSKHLDDYKNHKRYENDNNKYQMQVKRFQDILSPGESEIARGAQFSDNIRATSDAFGVLFGSTVMLPFHHIANTIFDWKIELVPSQQTYEKGIIRAFGTTDDKSRRESFQELKEITEKGQVPMWIINATNFEEGWLKIDNSSKGYRDLSNNVFEITPYGFGSGRYLHTDKSPDYLNLDLPRATLASAAFFDGLGNGPILFGLLHMTNLRWGIKVENYTTTEEKRNLHKFLLFPLYYFDMNNSDITLSDGGQSGDNLGLYSLIKRGTKNIVIVSGSNDTTFFNSKETLKLQDICSVNDYLIHKEHSEIFFYGEANDNINKNKIPLKTICTRENESKYKYYEWKQEIWKGYVKNLITNEETNKLFFIQAALNKTALDSETALFNSNKIEAQNNKFPSSLLYFWSDSESGNYASDFPQTSTIFHTLNGSQNLYQAYMDLGFYLSGYLKEDNDFMELLH